MWFTLTNGTSAETMQAEARNVLVGLGFHSCTSSIMKTTYPQGLTGPRKMNDKGIALIWTYDLEQGPAGPNQNQQNDSGWHTSMWVRTNDGDLRYWVLEWSITSAPLWQKEFKGARVIGDQLGSHCHSSVKGKFVSCSKLLAVKIDRWYCWQLGGGNGPDLLVN